MTTTAAAQSATPSVTPATTKREIIEALFSRIASIGGGALTRKLRLACLDKKSPCYLIGPVLSFQIGLVKALTKMLRWLTILISEDRDSSLLLAEEKEILDGVSLWFERAMIERRDGDHNEDMCSPFQYFAYGYGHAPTFTLDSLIDPRDDEPMPATEMFGLNREQLKDFREFVEACRVFREQCRRIGVPTEGFPFLDASTYYPYEYILTTAASIEAKWSAVLNVEATHLADALMASIAKTSDVLCVQSLDSSGCHDKTCRFHHPRIPHSEGGDHTRDMLIARFTDLLSHSAHVGFLRDMRLAGIPRTIIDAL